MSDARADSDAGHDDGLLASVRRVARAAVGADATPGRQGHGQVKVRPATRHDVPAIVALLADDPLGAAREDLSDPAAYLTAFDAIDADPAHALVVLDDDGEVVGTLQAHHPPRAVAARVDAGAHRSGARGQQPPWAAARRACSSAGQRTRPAAAAPSSSRLTTDATRVDAQRFYERLGFVGSHVGMKAPL